MRLRESPVSQCPAPREGIVSSRLRLANLCWGDGWDCGRSQGPIMPDFSQNMTCHNQPAHLFTVFYSNKIELPQFATTQWLHSSRNDQESCCLILPYFKLLRRTSDFPRKKRSHSISVFVKFYGMEIQLWMNSQAYSTLGRPSFRQCTLPTESWSPLSPKTSWRNRFLASGHCQLNRWSTESSSKSSSPKQCLTAKPSAPSRQVDSHGLLLGHHWKKTANCQLKRNVIAIKTSFAPEVLWQMKPLLWHRHSSESWTHELVGHKAGWCFYISPERNHMPKCQLLIWSHQASQPDCFPSAEDHTSSRCAYVDHKNFLRSHILQAIDMALCFGIPSKVRCLECQIRIFSALVNLQKDLWSSLAKLW